MVRHSNTWVFNISPENWESCVDGPADPNFHGKTHVGNPWHGTRRESEPDIESGDLILARITSADGANADFGVKGVWVFDEARKVNSQDEVPWTDAEYEWALYCRPLHRELTEPFTEDFGNEPSFSSNTLQGSIKSLEPADKQEYLTTLLNNIEISTEARERIQSEYDEDAMPKRTKFAEGTPSNDSPSIWFEKTYVDGRDYKQSGELALGKAIYSPAFGTDGSDKYPTMRECKVGDIVLHLVQDNHEIVGASRISSELQTDFEGLPEFGWTEEQYESGGYLRRLSNYEEFDESLKFYDEVLEKEQYKEPLLEIRENHMYLPFTRRLAFTQGDYLARCPKKLASILAAENESLKDYIDQANVKLPNPPEGANNTGEKTNDDKFNSTSFEKIGPATEEILNRLEKSSYPNILRRHSDLSRFEEWSRALYGFQPSSFVTPEDETVLLDLESVLYDLQPQLAEIAGDLNIGKLNHADPWEVVFLALLRDIQADLHGRGAIDFEPNANQPKLNVIKRRAYDAFDHPEHPLIKPLLDQDVCVYKLTAPPDYWLTALRYRAIGFEPDGETLWNGISEGVSEGDLLLFHAAGDPAHTELEKQSGYVFGGALVDMTFEDDSEWWLEAQTGERSYPMRVAFERLFLTQGAASLGDPPSTNEPVSRLSAAIARLQESALPISCVNELCDDAVESAFPTRTAAVELTDDVDWGRREAVLDALSWEVTEVSPVAIHRRFEGRIPAETYSHLHFPENCGVATETEIAQQVTAALRSGKHIIFTGPPGTGKTEIAEATTEHLENAYPNLFSGSRLTTATADWSTFDTVGGYMPDPDVDGDQLDFHPGVILNRFKNPDTGIQANEPTIIDEINRANIDKAFGQLFTTLSGQTVTLPYRLKAAPGQELEIVSHDEANLLVSRARFVIPASWRIFGTMNTFDKTSLYEMSYAFMRRFSFIRIGVPDIPSDGAEQEALLSKYTDDDVWNIDASPQQLRYVAAVWRATNTAVAERSIGPAIVEDILLYITAHETASDLSPRLTEAVISYIFPQLEGVPERKEIVRSIAGVSDIDEEELERAASDMLGISDLDQDSE
ncbi:AAA family ATPase [Halorarum salinum]|uniref:AAA family ATPase n=1 Tax=Halorarum salinum TaxID=2743089 RepID=A0A7D5LAZ0_9EURY|nr:AAA family ATPase [Halobaculum salinum]QLG62211.1 AAA family ATPase [Halobaculum salinum]